MPLLLLDPGRFTRIAMIAVSASVLLSAALAFGQEATVPDDQLVDVDKQAMLDAFRGSERFGAEPDLDTPLPEEFDVETDAKPDDRAQTLNGPSLVFEGLGYGGLKVMLSSSTSQSCRGYIVDATSSSYQDMAILEDLSSLGTGTKYITAACTDLHKSYPPPGHRMASTPWTSDSSSHWAYWVRKACVTGASRGYSTYEIQSAVWYITDRAGSYSDYPLLREIGYSSSGPSKNASSTTTSGTNNSTVQRLDTCGSGLCGAGVFPVLPLPLASLIGGKMALRRPRRSY